MIFFMVTSMTMTSYASWHWSSPWEVCGTDVIKKGEKCDLRDNHSHDLKSEIANHEKNESKTCKEGHKEIKKVSNGQSYCVKESSFEKLIQRGWGTNA